MEGFLNPNQVLDQLNLRKNIIAAEFGCGAGGFTIPLAQRLEEGLVYALDIQKPPLSALKGKSLAGRILNINIIRCDLEEPKGSTLPNSSLDLVLVPNMLFQTENKSAIITEAKRILKEKGAMVIIDWLPEASQGPKQGKISPAEVKKISKELGFKFEREINAGAYHYGLVFAR